MAVIITNGNTDLSAANGFYTVEAFNNFGQGNVLALSSERLIPLTFTSASANSLGVVLAINLTTTPTGAGAVASYYYDVLVELQENAGSWTTRASKQLTAAQITNGVANVAAHAWIVPFIWETPYAIDNTASKWRIRVTRAGTGTGNPSIYTSNGTAPSYAAWTNVAASFADNDIVIAKDILTIDQTATMRGTLGTGETAYAPALIICKSADPTVANVGNVVWENPPASSYTLTIDGTVCFGAHSGMRVGSSASRIPFAQQAIISFPSSTNGTSCGFKYSGNGFQTGRKASFIFYGERPAVERTTLAQRVYALNVTGFNAVNEINWANHGFSNGQAVYFTAATMPTGLTAGTIYYARVSDTSTPANRMFLYDTEEHAIAGGATGQITFSSAGTTVVGNTAIITTDTTGWAVGDMISVGGEISTGSDYATNRTISTISGNMISVTPAFASGRDRLAGHPVINFNGYGIKIIGNDTKIPVMYLNSPSNLILDGVEKADMGSIYQGTAGSTAVSNMNWDDAANQSKHFVTHGSCYRISSKSAALFYVVEAPLDGVEVSYINGGAYFILFYYGAISLATTQKSGSVLFDNVWVTGYNAILTILTGGMSVFGCAFSNNIFEGYVSGSPGLISLSGSNFILNNNKFFGSQSLGGALTLTTVLNLSGSGNTFDSCTNAIQFGIGAESNIQLTDTVFGGEVTNTNDYSFIEGSLVGYQENSPTGAVTVDTTNLAACSPGSLMKIRNYNDTAGDIRSWQPEGTFVSDSGKMVGKTIAADVALESIWKNTSDAISGQSCAVSVGCQIANAAYYADSYTAPSLKVNYDSTSATDSASASTAAQTLLAEFSPTVDNANITVTLSQETDAAYADSGVTWDSLSFKQRRYGKTENAYTKIITEVTSDVVFNWATLPDNIFIDEADSATVAAYTGITINHSTQTMTIDENHTIAEVYDFTQYDLTQYMEVDAWFTTIDGVTYDSAYDIVIDGAAFTATGKTINCGSKDFSLINDGTVDAYRITDVDGTLSSLTFTGLKVGSEVRLYKTSDDSEISGGIEETTGTTHTFNFLHTTDITVYAAILSLGYENMMVEGLTLTNTAQTVPVSQRFDRQYYNPA